MDKERDAKILETVLEELETGKGKASKSRVKSEQLTKPAQTVKSKIGGRSKKSKRDKSVTENETRQTKTIVVPLSEETENRTRTHESTQAVVEHESVENSRELSNLHTVDNEKEHNLTGMETEESINAQPTTTNVENGNVKGNTKDESNKLFTRMLSLKTKESGSLKRDLIITPNQNLESDTPNKSDTLNNKENTFDKKASALSQEFIRSNSDKSILTTRSEPHRNVSRPLPKRRRPMSTNALSKKALEAYLPRKSFFSSHDRVLREAGFQVDDAMKNKKRPNWRLILRMHTEEELNPDFGAEEKTEVKEPQNKEESDDDGEETFNFIDAVETLMSQGKDDQTPKRRLKLTAKKLGMEEKCDYKQLLDYLKYINDHPEEYMNMARYSSKNTDYKHPSVMVRMARVFRKAHHGTARNNIFTHALAGLKPKIAEPQTQQRHGRGEHSRADFGASKKDQNDIPQEQSNSPLEEGKTEMEKLKFKTEKWMGGLTTMQILRAKELALKDMGEEDITVTKWWLAFKTCNYLRIPPTVLEQAQ